MKEQQIHEAFMVWLKRNRLYYIHSTFGKKATMTKDAPDFIILHCNRVLLIECKTEQGKLTAGQKEKFEQIRVESGMVVQIVRSVPEAVQAVEHWLGVEKPHSEALGPYSDHDWPGMKEAVRKAGVTAPKQPELPVNGNGAKEAFYIGNWRGTDWVFARDTDGGYRQIRQASAADIINFSKIPA